MFHLAWLLPYLQTLYYPGKTCKRQTLKPIKKISKFTAVKSLITLALGSFNKTFTVVVYGCRKANLLVRATLHGAMFRSKVS